MKNSLAPPLSSTSPSLSPPPPPSSLLSLSLSFSVCRDVFPYSHTQARTHTDTHTHTHTDTKGHTFIRGPTLANSELNYKEVISRGVPRTRVLNAYDDDYDGHGDMSIRRQIWLSKCPTQLLLPRAFQSSVLNKSILITYIFCAGYRFG